MKLISSFTFILLHVYFIVQCGSTNTTATAKDHPDEKREDYTFCGRFIAKNGDFTFITFGISWGKWIVFENGSGGNQIPIIPKVGQKLYKGESRTFCASGKTGWISGVELYLFGDRKPQ
ncbi:uncharacterized protein LOC116350214 [Contarinia nasturtii]|uniref:uncharacterized protein LOC116350214 n=1 Tax=Contarinia nasturtii TaxID=265458 RepID=UPI0012D4212A|nr:uncharacterized protein LOC116350214 [Contarinia nasturtii]